MSKRIPVIDHTRREPRKVIRSFDELPAVMETADAALTLGLCIETVKKMCQRKEIPAMKIGKFWRIRKDKLLEYINSMEQQN